MSEHGIPALVPLARGVDGFSPPQVEPVGRAQYLVYQRRRPSVPSLVVKAICDRLLAALLLVVLSPLLAAARAGRPDLRGEPAALRSATRRPLRASVFDAEVPDHARRRRGGAGGAAGAERDGRPGLQADQRSTRHPLRTPPAAVQPRRAAAALQRALRPDEPGRPAPAAGRGDRGADRRVPAAALDAPGADLLSGRWAGGASCRSRNGWRSISLTSIAGAWASTWPSCSGRSRRSSAGAGRAEARRAKASRTIRRRRRSAARRWCDRNAAPPRAAARARTPAARAGRRRRASASGVGSAKSTPVSPSRTESSEPPAAKATTGRPAASASTGTMPKSSSAGWTTARQAA